MAMKLSCAALSVHLGFVCRHMMVQFILLTFLTIGCTDKQKASDSKVYFDLRGFFTAEAERLQKQSLPILKTVTQNQSQEQKEIIITDWNNELSLFMESDINKPSWKKSYTLLNEASTIEYTAKDDDLRTRKISIKKSAGGEVLQILIKNGTSNWLYTSTEELIYYPDSLYSINKHQKVRVLGINNYNIAGKFQRSN